MTMRKLTRQGMKGRKRDTRLLGLVVALSFAFIVCASSLLSSMTHTENMQRMNLYGRWQTMVYGAQEEEIASYSQHTDAQMAVSALVGKANLCGMVASIDDALMEMGAFSIKEGRLPQAPGEILLVADEEAQDYAVGDTVTLVYAYTHVAMASTEETQNIEQTQSWFFPYLNLETDRKSEFEAWWEKDGRTVLSRELPGYPALAQSLTEVQYKTAMSIWSMRYFKDEYNIARLSRYESDLYGTANLSIALRYQTDCMTLYGAGFGKDHGKEIESDRRFTKMTAQRTYTVCGLIEPYAQRWDVAQLEMPGAYVCAQEAALMHEQIALVHAAQPGLSEYRPESVLFFRDENQSAQALYSALAPVYEAGQQGKYRVQIYQEAGSENIGGYLAGTDAATGEIAYVSFAGSEGLVSLSWQGKNYSVSTAALKDGSIELEGLDPYDFTQKDQESVSSQSELPFRMNTFAYPPDVGSAQRMLRTMMTAGLFLITFCAVFLIYLTQIRRRTRRIALMKAIGAHNGQIAQMLLWEGAYLLMAALPAGCLLGAGVAGVILFLRQGEMVAHIDAISLAGGIASGVAAVWAGLLCSGLSALRVPLTGSMEAPQKASLLPARASRKRRQTPLRLTLRSMRVNLARTTMHISLCTLLLLVTLITVFLGHQSLSHYRESVVRPNMPAYTLRLSYGAAKRLGTQLTDEALTIDGIERVQTILQADGVLMECAQLLRESPLLTLEKSEDSAQRFHKTQLGEQVEITLLGVDGDAARNAALIASLEAAAASGRIDWEKIESGEECIAFVPLYRDAEMVRTSVWASDRYAYARDLALEAGDVLSLTGLVQSQPGDPKTPEELEKAPGDPQKYLRHAQVRVGAVIHVFPESGVWPFSGGVQSYSLLCGRPLVKALYPSSSSRMTAYQAQLFKTMVDIFYPHCFATTQLHLYDDGQGAAALDSAVYAFARQYGAQVINHRMTNQALESEALNNRLMFTLLGAAAALIVLAILRNTLQSAALNERRRTGVLQSLGVSGGELMGMKLLEGTAASVASLLIANAVMACVVAGTTLAADGGAAPLAALRVMTETTLWRYPWGTHGLICAIFALVTTILYAWPLRTIAGASAIDNIRS